MVVLLELYYTSEASRHMASETLQEYTAESLSSLSALELFPTLGSASIQQSIQVNSPYNPNNPDHSGCYML